MMSSKEVKEKLKTTVKSVKELMEVVVKATHAEITSKSPKLVHTLDSSIDKASGAFTDALRTIDKRTLKEQRTLLEAYKTFLNKQIELLDRKLEDISGSESSSKASQSES
jgi:signal transduction protein with GAF and PtsI domain